MSGLIALTLALAVNVATAVWGMRQREQAYRYAAALCFVAAGFCVLGILDALAVLSGASHG